MAHPPSFAATPAHVLPEKIFAFDIHMDEALLADPHQRASDLVATAPPFFWTPHNGGHWMALRYADAFEIYRNPDLFSSSPLSPDSRAAIQASMPPGAPRMIELTPILMDPPEHTKFRAPLQRAFSPRTMMGMKAEITALAHSLIDEVVEQGGCDVFASISEQLPVRLFLKMMGLPAERLSEFRDLVREVFAPSTDPMEQVGRIRKIAEAMRGQILARRTDPKDDLISLLWSLELDGEPVGYDLVEDYAALLFLAGLDTVINGISFGMRHLAQDLDLQRRLRAQPELIVDASEELLRRYTFTVSQRRVTRDVEFKGQLLKEGDMVVLYLPAADLDPTEFANPTEFSAEREHKVHMAFGAGPHRCLGSHLARVELQTLYEVVLKRLPEFRLDLERPPVFHGGMMLSISSLPIRWD